MVYNRKESRTYNLAWPTISQSSHDFSHWRYSPWLAFLKYKLTERSKCARKKFLRRFSLGRISASVNRIHLPVPDNCTQAPALAEEYWCECLKHFHLLITKPTREGVSTKSGKSNSVTFQKILNPTWRQFLTNLSLIIHCSAGIPIPRSVIVHKTA